MEGTRGEQEVGLPGPRTDDLCGDASSGAAPIRETWTVTATVHADRRNIFCLTSGAERHVGTLISGSSHRLQQFERDALLAGAAPELLEALRGAIGALEFSRDYHSDLSNEEQAFAQDKLDAALKALAKAEGRA